MTTARLFVDAREMEPPEPFTAACACLDVMSSGEFFLMIHRREPKLLFPEAERRGLENHVEHLGDDVLVYIWRKNDDAGKSAAMANLQAYRKGTA